jgi:3-dehydroquinate dehydratase/shikimate dehydrogenase
MYGPFASRLAAHRRVAACGSDLRKGGSIGVAALCGIVARKRHEKVLEEIDLAAKLNLGLAEVRLDFLNRDPRLGEIARRRKLPLIATFRRKSDGGLFSGSEEKRRALLRAAVAQGFDYVDIEADVIRHVPRYGDAKRIVSFHDLDGVPDNLEDVFDDLQSVDADIVKIAVKAHKGSDVFRVLRLYQSARRPTVAFCMGEWGVASRILCAKFGAPFSYAAVNVMRLVAPGLLTVEEMRDVYFFERIDAATEAYGVVGDPVAQSLSPLVHNTCFRQQGYNKVYVPFRVKKEDFNAFLDTSDAVPMKGFSVTIPHKQAAALRGKAMDDLVGKSQAANTLIRSGDGWLAYNTDAPAAVDAAWKVLPEDPESGLKSIGDRKVLILGAGGVARSVAAAFVDRGALVTLASRRDEEARGLAHALKCRALRWEERYEGVYDVVVNCTPLGMTPKLDDSAYHQSALREGQVVLDTVYNPENTLLVREAKARGCRVATGVEMFATQAEMQFTLFTDGGKAPAGVAADLVREEFSPARSMLRSTRLRQAQSDLSQ